MRPSVTGNPVLIGKELRELDGDTYLLTDCYDQVANAARKTLCKDELDELLSSTVAQRVSA